MASSLEAERLEESLVLCKLCVFRSCESHQLLCQRFIVTRLLVTLQSPFLLSSPCRLWAIVETDVWLPLQRDLPSGCAMRCNPSFCNPCSGRLQVVGSEGEDAAEILGSVSRALRGFSHSDSALARRGGMVALHSL